MTEKEEILMWALLSTGFRCLSSTNLGKTVAVICVFLFCHLKCELLPLFSELHKHTLLF